jgi:hypothetical protein
MRVATLLGALALAQAVPAVAQTGAANVEEVRRLLDDARRAVEELESRVRALEQQQSGRPAAPAAAPAAPAAAPAPAASGTEPSRAAPPAPAPAADAVRAPNTVAEPSAGKGARLEVYGFAQADVIYDTGQMDPSWGAAFRPSKIPVVCPGDPGCGNDGKTTFSVQQSRLGFRGFMPTGLGELRTIFEFDLFGTGSDAGKTTFRLRHAWGELGNWGAGQYWSTFMDPDVFPNTIDYWGPSGMIFLRNPQVRWTPWRSSDSSFSVALESPGAAIDPGNTTAPGVGLTGRTRLPDLAAHYRNSGAWGHLQVAGILRSVGYESINGAAYEPSGTRTGWGLNLSGSWATVGRDRIRGQLMIGEAVASYINDCCVDLAPDASGNLEAVPLVGWLLYYDRWWSDRWSSSIGYSEARQDNTEGQAGDAFKTGQYFSVNLLHYPARNVMFGGELLWGRHTHRSGASADDTRLQFSAKFAF